MPKYRCTNCNFLIDTTPFGHYTDGKEHYYLFCCYDCAYLQAINCKEVAKLNFMLGCDKCGRDIYTWNPVYGKCPNCKSELIEF